MAGVVPETRKTALPDVPPATSGHTGYTEHTQLRIDQLTTKGNQTPWRVYTLTLISGIGGFLFGYDTGVISGAMLLLRENFHLNYVWQELVVSATIAAAALFSLIAGPLNDRIGRKTVLLLASVLFCSGGLGMSLAQDRFLLLFGRLLVGAGIGFTSTTIPMYIAEAAPAEVRGRLVSSNVVLIACGQFVANIVAGMFSSDTVNGWRYMFGFGIIPAVIQCIGMLFLPESPRWLIMKGRLADARKVLESIRGHVDVDHELSSIQDCCMESTKQKEARKANFIIYQMLTTPSTRRALVIGCGVMMFQQFAGINTVMYYSATIVKMSGVQGGTDSAAIWLSALVAATNFAFTFVGVYLVERIGRRPLIIASLLGAITSLIWLATGFYLSSTHSPPIQHVSNSSFNDMCTSYMTCNGCITDKNCGFCYIEQRVMHTSMQQRTYSFTAPKNMNGTCLSVDVIHPNFPLGDNQCDSSASLKRNWAYDFCPSPYAWMTLAGLVLYLIFFAPGMGPMPWTINSEIYPTWARSTGMSTATFVNWMCNLLISMTFLSLTQAATKYGAFWVYAILATFGLVYISIFLPETRGKSLEQVEGLFARTSYPGLTHCFKVTGTDDSDDEDGDGKRFQYVHIRGLNKSTSGSTDYDSS